ncbi:MAG: chromosome segregation protein SMC [Myxococcota bacterium]|nr:chromosome segregation protein SMC [Myxococcota bacterium]
MRIKSLEISGFKSFADRVVLGFQPGITGIVGPNGCGKSNVVDAMRWCMGEQAPRRLRGKGMEDVIFAGTETRGSVGLAQVVLTFDNAEGRAPAAFAGYPEIQIARRLYRSGESEYAINKTPCRLRDVHDFFRDTGIGTRGYTIVEQGQIASIVSARPGDRRQLIEEAAGIGKYKARRQEAERKLEGTEQNLLRVSDVLGEIRRQIQSLERQARKAARFKRLQARAQLLELSLAADDRRELMTEIDEAGRRLAAQRDEAEASALRLAERETDLDRMRLELAERERAVVTRSEVLFRLRSEIKQLESRIEYEQRERETLALARASREEERTSLQTQLATARHEEQTAAEELAQLEARLATEQAGLADAEAAARAAGETLRRLEADREALNPRLVDALTGIARAEDRVAALEQRRTEIARRLRSADEALEVQQGEATRVDAEQRRLEEGLENLLGDRERLRRALQEATSRHERAVAQARDAAERLRAARELASTRAARLGSLREVLGRAEDLGGGTRHLVEQGEQVRSAHGLRGLVRDVLEVDPAAERAVEVVLRERAEALVASGLDAALAALGRVREAGAGRAVLVLDPLEETPRTGFVPLGEPLLGSVRAQPGYEAVARALLGDVVLVADLGEVRKAYGGGTLPATFVTPDGDVLSPDGVLVGGGEAGSGVLARVREVRDLEREVLALESQGAARSAEHAAAEAELAQASDELDNLRNRHHTAALAVANHEKDLERSRERLKATLEVQDGRTAERSELVSEGEALEVEGEALVQRLEALRAERAEAQRVLDALSAQIGQAGRELQRLDAAFTERRVALAACAEKRDRLAQGRGRAAEAARETEAWIARREHEIEEMDARRAQLGASTEEARSRLHEKLREEDEARAASDRARDDFEAASEEVRVREEEVRHLRTEGLARRERIQASELAMRERALRVEQIEQRVRDLWHVEIASWAPPAAGEPVVPAAGEPVVPVAGAAEADEARTAESEAPAERSEAEPIGDPAADPLDAESAEPVGLSRSDAEWATRPREERVRHLAEVSKRVQSLGDVNVGAIEEHEELAERQRFLAEQKSDLENTVAQLREAIARINRASRKRFRETFEAVNERFQHNFPRLFRGGKASLSLTESDDLLEAGVDIMAQPPGKRLQNVGLLSGGEKTLTALALLVSLFQVHPSPFFLLDEVDAALDDANVGRFNEIVRDMSSQSQFLIITHNKATIEIADVLYGVTMEEKGVSKLVSVQLRDA